MAREPRTTTTLEALAAHMTKWRKGKGFNANPLGEQAEMIRWLCGRLDRGKPQMCFSKRNAIVCIDSREAGE